MTQALWSAFLPGDMPEGCTYEQFAAARDYLWKNQDKKWLADYMGKMVSLSKHNDEGVRLYVERETEWVQQEIQS